jgi:phosphinothricin acetyltransferase
VDPVIVRAAGLQDAEEIARIYNHHVDAGGSTFDTQHWTIDDVVHDLQKPKPDGWFVATGDGHARLFGWCSARRFSGRHGYRFTCETAIYLDPHAQGRGIAGRLQTQLEAHCRRFELHHAVAKIIADNERSLAFHRRHGYETVGIQREVGHMNGRWVDLVILQKILSSS